MIHLKNNSEIEKMYYAGQIVKNTLFMLEEFIKPGITTIELDRMAEEFILKQKAKPGFKGLYDFPNTLCVSIDDEVVHGLPSNTELKEGQIVGIDVGSIYEGFYGDHAKTFKVGKVEESVEQLVETTKESLYKGIEQAIDGNTIGDIGYAIQTYCEQNSYSIVKDLVGHGIGRKLHEDPQIPNYGNKGHGVKIEVGMCMAIEPMVNLGKSEVISKEDGWTISTLDGSLSAHFEHTIAVTEKGTKILTK
tara:strand:- start:1210 stop:1953 length:744 start_codon:yes stop_codon:yes gene_type:complete